MSIGPISSYSSRDCISRFYFDRPTTDAHISFPIWKHILCLIVSNLDHIVVKKREATDLIGATARQTGNKHDNAEVTETIVWNRCYTLLHTRLTAILSYSLYAYGYYNSSLFTVSHLYGLSFVAEAPLWTARRLTVATVPGWPLARAEIEPEMF